MTLSPAPYFTEIAEGPTEAAAHWVTAEDGVRLRVAHWGGDTPRGTILMFPGRSEYIEKYAQDAGDFEKLGYGMLAIDWRGQGLADRLHKDPMMGHVGEFRDYQLDVAAMLEAADALKLPKPYFLLAHSMGGAIGLRAVIDGMPVQACTFSAPMWGIHISPAMRPVAWAVSEFCRRIGLGNLMIVSGSTTTYVLNAPFEDNTLTNDAELYAFMQRQAQAHPELTIGSPTMRWLNEALWECRSLRASPLPDLPCQIWLGSDEQVVDPKSVRDVMLRWDEADFRFEEGCRHEILMEAPEYRNRAILEIAAHFQRAMTVS